MSTPTGVAVIGTGSIAEAHLHSYQRLSERVRLAAVVDVDGERAAVAAERYGAADVCQDYRDVLARDDVHAVSICTPPFLHKEISVAALRAGKHVLCEKPVAATLTELDAIEEAERESGCVFSGVFQLRFGRGAQQLRLLFDEGKFGRLHLGLAETLWYRDQSYYDEAAWRGSWETECGGVTVSQAVHIIDMLLWFMGEPSHVYAEAGTFLAPTEADDCSVAVVRFRNGAIGQITNTISSYNEQRSLLEFHGAGLSAVSQSDVYDATAQPFHLSSADPDYGARIQHELDERIPKGYRLLHRGAVADFLDAIAEDRPPLAGIDACRAALQVTTAIYKSSMTGERVDLPIAPDDPFYSALPPPGFALPATPPA